MRLLRRQESIRWATVPILPSRKGTVLMELAIIVIAATIGYLYGTFRTARLIKKEIER